MLLIKPFPEILEKMIINEDKEHDELDPCHSSKIIITPVL